MKNEPSTTIFLYIVSRKEIEGIHLANILGWLFIKDEILERNIGKKNIGYRFLVFQ